MKTSVPAPTQRKSSKSRKKAEPTPAASETADISGEKPWNSVRKDKVARAKKLLQDADYPSSDVIRSVAGLLARSWNKPENS